MRSVLSGLVHTLLQTLWPLVLARDLLDGWGAGGPSQSTLTNGPHEVTLESVTLQMKKQDGDDLSCLSEVTPPEGKALRVPSFSSSPLYFLPLECGLPPDGAKHLSSSIKYPVRSRQVL